jgi:hypothetical protein
MALFITTACSATCAALLSARERGAGNSQALMAGVWPVLHNVRRA